VPLAKRFEILTQVNRRFIVRANHCLTAADLRDHRVWSANASPTRSASEDVFACAMFDVTATTMPLSRPVSSDMTMPPASSPLTLPELVASAKRTRSDGVE
jgi:hypothetical protein